MASTYVNNLRLNELATGDGAGTWGTTTNTNLELIGEALGFGTEAITTNADTHTSTVADGSTDAARAMYIKYTGTLDSDCTITIGPNTLKRVQFIENATSGSQNIIISQGSGANITIPPGDVKVVYLDGAGSGAAVVDAFASLNVVDLKVQDDLTVTDDVAIGGLATVGGTLGVTGIVTLTDDLIIGDGKTIGSASDVDAMTIASNGQVTFTQTLIGTALDISGDIDVDGTTNLDVVDIDGAVDMATTLAVAGNVDFNGDLDVDGTTNLDVVDIDGAVDMASTLTVAGVLTGASLDISGDIDIDGTTNLDVVDIDGAVDMASTLTVGGNVSITAGNLSITGDGSNAATFTETGAGLMTIAAPDDIVLDAGGDILFDAAGSDFRFQVGGTGLITITNSSLSTDFSQQQSNSDIRFKGNDGGSTITALTLDMSEAGLAIFNAGVAIGGTGAANTLDDYEEGTFDVAVGRVGSDATADGYAVTASRYVKVGKMVTAWVNVKLSAANSGGTAAAARITGLPFAGANYGSFKNPVVIATVGVLSTDVSDNGVMFYVEDSSASMQGRIVDNADTILPSNYIQNGTYIQLVISYDTA